jgi:hypothetical protein
MGFHNPIITFPSFGCLSAFLYGFNQHPGFPPHPTGRHQCKEFLQRPEVPNIRFNESDPYSICKTLEVGCFPRTTQVRIHMPSRHPVNTTHMVPRTTQPASNHESSYPHMTALQINTRFLGPARLHFFNQAFWALRIQAPCEIEFLPDIKRQRVPQKSVPESCHILIHRFINS